jgi:hypothetical protein
MSNEITVFNNNNNLNIDLDSEIKKMTKFMVMIFGQ